MKVKNIIVLLFGIILLGSCEKKAIEHMAFEQERYYLNVGDTVVIHLSYMNESGMVHGFSWAIEDAKVARLGTYLGNFDQQIIGRKKGTTRVVVQGANASASCEIIVGQVSATDLVLSRDTIWMHVGDVDNIICKVLPDNTTDIYLSCNFGKKDIATVAASELTVKDSAVIMVSALKIDTTTLNVSVKNSSVFATCVIVVLPTPVEGIQCDPTLNVLIGDTLQPLSCSFIPSSATNKEYTLETSNPDCLSLDSVPVGKGKQLKMIARQIGDADLIFTSKDGNHQATCQAHVLDVDGFASLDGKLGKGTTDYVLNMNFATNCSAEVELVSLLVKDENSNILLSLPLAQKDVVTYSFPFHTLHSVTDATYSVSGWKCIITYRWKGKEYTAIKEL